MNRFVDGVSFVPLDKPPATPSQLFNKLGVFGASRGEQQVAVDAWLEHNEPVTNLRLALEYRGFMDKQPRL
jgi:hypothetical protein